MEIIKSAPFLRNFAKAFNLEFDSKFRYYVGNAYTDSKGEYLKSYYYYNGNIFKLKYFDGCFNPYLVMLPKEKFGLVFVDNSSKIDFVVEASTQKRQKYYNEKFGHLFSMC